MRAPCDNLILNLCHSQFAAPPGECLWNEPAPYTVEKHVFLRLPFPSPYIPNPHDMVTFPCSSLSQFLPQFDGQADLTRIIGWWIQYTSFPNTNFRKQFENILILLAWYVGWIIMVLTGPSDKTCTQFNFFVVTNIHIINSNFTTGLHVSCRNVNILCLNFYTNTVLGQYEWPCMAMEKCVIIDGCNLFVVYAHYTVILTTQLTYQHHTDTWTRQNVSDV